MKPIIRRLTLVEATRKPRTPWEMRSKAERDAAVAAILNEPARVRTIMVGLVGEENATRRTDAFIARRATIAAAMRADT